jgi:glutamine amidotransferase
MSSAPSVAIVDYALGNIESVRLAFAHVGVQAVVSASPGELADAGALVLPGVGAFGDAMAALEKRGLVRVLIDFAASGRPLVGICLGMQLMFGRSEEFGAHEGLGLVPGTVRRFPSPRLGDISRYGPGTKVPQVGWNRVEPPANRPDAWQGSLLEGVEFGAHMYFMHSFYVDPDARDVVIGESEYAGVRFCSAIQRANVTGFQFHPERSAEAGLSIYRNFARRLSA